MAINKELLNAMVKHETQVIEKALVQLFIEINNIKVKNNTLIIDIISDKSKEIISLKNDFHKTLKLSKLTDFVNIFELLVPNDDKKINGAFFTPKLITDYITSETIKNPEQKICDPSCGCGAFLISATELISKKFKKKIIKTIEENIFGMDIAEYSIKRSKIFELGINIMKKDGILGYITPNNYFTSLSGIQLREYLKNNNLLKRILDFNHLKLFEAQTYTCITFLDVNKHEYFEYERIDKYENLKNLNDLTYSKMLYKNIDNKKWRLLKESDQVNIKNIEEAGNRLGDIVDIRAGIATCKDSVFFVNGDDIVDGFYRKEHDGVMYKIEKESTKPIAKISDFKNTEQLCNNSRRIIFPYEKKGNKMEIIKEDKFQKLYPLCHEYLMASKKDLATRDKGKKEYPEWYSYARTQGLNFLGEKLLTPTFSEQPRFMLEDNTESLFCNGYAIYPKSEGSLFLKNKITLETLSKILNSNVMDYYIKRTSVSIEGGYPCYQKNFIELFGIPNFTDEELTRLEKTTKKDKIEEYP